MPVMSNFGTHYERPNDAFNLPFLISRLFEPKRAEKQHS